ncbi:MAG: DNA-directed RNA polymerase subunit alpha [Anaerolineae bacterium]|nr:DNA-directed RNA polymerase subunit alpha [Anaerolineae bacterium]MDW8100089.1 DNA-directed RNA polymerase subunit alpha [Anaerolineae bacterium]
MFNQVLPKIESDASSQNYGRFIIGPLESGYGITLGNALRRVLLSSLPGAAVTSIRINGVHHEFSPIPNVREDTTTLILNVKQIRLRYHQDEPVRLYLEVHSEGPVTAGDIRCPPEVEIVNPDLYLLTVDSAGAGFEMELTVQRGKGYSPAEERGKLPLGEIPVDAIFSPVRKVSYSVERARVGQQTDFDRLVLEVWTDGTMSPHEAVSEGAKILVRLFQLVAGIERVEAETLPEKEEGIPSRIYDVAIEDLELSVRAYNCLKRAGITRVGEILEKLQQGEDEVLAIRNFGRKSLDELLARLEEKGYLSVINYKPGSSSGRRNEEDDDAGDEDEAESQDVGEDGESAVELAR